MIGLDFETRCALDLTKVGLDNYLNHPSFHPLIAHVREGRSLKHGWNLLIPEQRDRFIQYIEQVTRVDDLAAHNSAFEARVLERAYGISCTILDTAVIARVQGAASSLEQCAPQLLDKDKLPDGRRLIKKFSIGEDPLDPSVFDDPDWDLFGEYCQLDADLSWEFTQNYTGDSYSEQITQQMNAVGWKVDTAAVSEMMRRVEENKTQALLEFRERFDQTGELNLNSLAQLKKWCLERKIRAHSFSEENVTKLLARIEARAAQRGWDENLLAVAAMLRTKQIIGGSSVSKLPVIQARTSTIDGRLRDQYLHYGASQTGRTSGVAVQMQNLHRLGEDLADMNTLFDPAVHWSNDDIAKNLRQVFTASQPDGRLIVGDFSSVESRGLAYLAGEEWKLEEYRHGKDMYKVLAAKINKISYEEVTKPQRQGGKVGELSCGYNAGAEAVAAFAEKMHIPLTVEEATLLVSDWRDVNPKIVQLWRTLDDALHDALKGDCSLIPLGNNLEVRILALPTLDTIQRQHPGAQDLHIIMQYPGRKFFTRIFRGAYLKGRTIIYHKPSTRKTGDLWRDWTTDPKTKLIKNYTIYGGKLSGILTQSMCRELFFDSLRMLARKIEDIPNVKLVGQFHDEIVLDWVPSVESGSVSLSWAAMLLEDAMTHCRLSHFPLAADIKWDYRYTK